MSAPRLGILLCVLALALVGLTLSMPAAATPEGARSAEGRRFDPDSIKAPRGSARQLALAARTSGDHAQARARALAGLPHAKRDEAMLLRWIAAQSARDLGDVGAAAELLRPIASSDHALSTWAKLSLAECNESRDPVEALALVDALLAPSRDVQGWPGRTAGERVRARVLQKLGRRGDAIAALEQLADEARDESATLQVLVPLAELLAQGDEQERMRAFALARRVVVGGPDTRAGRRAQELLLSLVKTFPESMRRELEQPRVEDKLRRAETLAAQLRYEEAANVYAELEASANGDAELFCRARYGRAKALLDRRARSEGSVLMADVATRCTQDSDRRAWARYHAGRAYSQLGQNELALAQYEALEREAPGHSLADDALYRAAKVARDMGDSGGLVERLHVLAERYPRGDMRARAQFALAWEAFTQGDLPRAIEIVSADERDENTEDLQGRSRYFRARWLADLGDKEAAIEAYERAFEHAPLSYFGQLAHSRLVSLAPARARELTARLSRVRGGKLTFTERPELASAGFRRALALLSVGEITLASWELRGLGFTSESADVELGMLAVALLDRAEAPELALEQARRHMPRLLTHFPHGHDVAMYELVYPVAFPSVIERAAKKEGVPAALLRGVAREESGFNPNAVSRAHAYGLVQLLLPTARSLVKSARERVRDASALLRPELNLTLGARFMATLAENQRGMYALVPPAYNAGPGAVARWLRERGGEPLDVWVENIPYDETRGYTRRVLQSYGVYHWLATGELLRLPVEPLVPQSAPTTLVTR